VRAGRRYPQNLPHMIRNLPASPERTAPMAIAHPALAALVCAFGALVATPAPASDGSASAADLNFVMKAHAAASYGAAASKLAQSCREAPIRPIGRKLAVQDAQLETHVRAAAAKLSLQLPATDPGLPARQLQGKTLATAYVNRLRSTDSALLQLAVAVRVTTRSDVVRDLAHDTASVMMTQLPLLEGSGMIDLDAQPTPTSSAPTRSPGGIPSPDPEMLAGARAAKGFLWPSPGTILLILGAALLGAGFASWHLLTATGRHRQLRRKVRRPGARTRRGSSGRRRLHGRTGRRGARITYR